jgi:hypothetical protein
MPFMPKASLTALTLAAGLAVQARDPMVIVNTSNRPWRVLSEPLTAGMKVTCRDAGGEAVTREAPALDSRSWDSVWGPELGSAGQPAKNAARNRYDRCFTLDVTLRSGEAAILETTGDGQEEVITRFRLIDADDRERHIDPETKLHHGCLTYHAHPPEGKGESGWRYRDAAPGGVVAIDAEAPNLARILADSWVDYPTRWNDGALSWTGREDPWARDLRKQGLDPEEGVKAWRAAKARDPHRWDLRVMEKHGEQRCESKARP